jgi:hypothetical protein
MKCPHCGVKNFVWARRCEHCAAPIARSGVASRPKQKSAAPLDASDKRALRDHWHCDCFKDIERSVSNEQAETRFHPQIQDIQSKGWKRVLELIDIAAAEDWEEFAPFRGMKWEIRSDVITLPPTIGKLKSVRRLVLTSSCLVRLPAEIGDMENLVQLDAYMSYRLHWLPYEVTRCFRLDETVFSTRALYGNYKFRSAFPRLDSPILSTAGVDLENLPPDRHGAPAITTCSVCRTPLKPAGLYQAWISLNVGTDVLPVTGQRVFRDLSATASSRFPGNRQNASLIADSVDGPVYATVRRRSDQVLVYIAAETRCFYLAFWRRGVNLADGRSANLGEAAQAIDTWIRSSRTCEQFATQFRFVRVSNDARAYERGEEVETRWQQLLAGRHLPGVNAIVRVAAAEPRLRQLFPFLRHFTLVFSRCTGYLFTRDTPAIAGRARNGRRYTRRLMGHVTAMDVSPDGRRFVMITSLCRGGRSKGRDR